MHRNAWFELFSPPFIHHMRNNNNNNSQGEYIDPVMILKLKVVGFRDEISHYKSFSIKSKRFRTSWWTPNWDSTSTDRVHKHINKMKPQSISNKIVKFRFHFSIPFFFVGIFPLSSFALICCSNYRSFGREILCQFQICIRIKYDVYLLFYPRLVRLV